MTQITLHHGDNRDHLRRLIAEGVRVHSVVTDPPYGLTSITKRFGAENAAPAKFGSDGAFQRASGGFMGSKWDSTGIERDPEFWALLYDILLPGGYVLAFSSPRTGHWQACAMEMAGFVMHPFLGWVYGQGFPKDHDAAMAIDKALGQPGHKAPVGEPVRRLRPGAEQHRSGEWEKLEDRFYQPGTYVPGTQEGEQWNGWAYGAQSLKPALEPIYMGQKPFSEKSGALNLLKHGVGAVNIDGCRVENPDFDPDRMQRQQSNRQTWEGGVNSGFADDHVQATYNAQGRHPANLLHDGSAEVIALFPQSAGQIASSSSDTRKNQNCYGEMRRGAPGTEMHPRGDSGSAARFFNAFPLDGDPIRYQAKATKADRAGSKHPTVKPIDLKRWLCRLVTPPGGTVLDPFAGSGTTGEAARLEGFNCILMEAEDQFAADIRRRLGLPSPQPQLPVDILAMIQGSSDPIAMIG